MRLKSRLLEIFGVQQKPKHLLLVLPAGLRRRHLIHPWTMTMRRRWQRRLWTIDIHQRRWQWRRRWRWTMMIRRYIVKMRRMRLRGRMKLRNMSMSVSVSAVGVSLAQPGNVRLCPSSGRLDKRFQNIMWRRRIFIRRNLRGALPDGRGGRSGSGDKKALAWQLSCIGVDVLKTCSIPPITLPDITVTDIVTAFTFTGRCPWFMTLCIMNPAPQVLPEAQMLHHHLPKAQHTTFQKLNSPRSRNFLKRCEESFWKVVCVELLEGGAAALWASRLEHSGIWHLGWNIGWTCYCYPPSKWVDPLMFFT